MITNNTTNTEKRETNVKVRSSAQVGYKKPQNHSPVRASGPLLSLTVFPSDFCC